jgi:periplasmic protein TonB
MTVSYSPQAFEKSRVLRPAGESLPERDRLVSIAITIAVHGLIAIAALTTVQVVRPKVMQELSVQITPERPKPLQEPKQLPKLAPPAPVTAPVPEVVIQTAPPPPVIAQPPVAAPIAPSVPAPVTGPQGTGEGRDSFLARLLAQLNRVKQYPRAARQARIEGVVMLHFVMDAQGKLVSFEIAKSSGRPVLDNEALALIQRAQLPPLPAGFPTNTLDAVVPLQFSLDN